MIIASIMSYLRSTTFLSECALLLHLPVNSVYDWDVRQNESYIFLGDVSIAVEIISMKDHNK